MNKLTIAITGSSGYIGSYLTKYFLAKEYNVYSMGRKFQVGTEFIPFELSGNNDYTKLGEVDVLIHCAYDFSIHNKKLLNKINYLGTIDLFKQAKLHGVKKIIFLSTTSSFADAKSHYGQLKFALEEKANEFDAIIVRPGLVFGNNLSGVLKSMNEIVKKLKVIPLIGNGEQKFYPCHLADFAALIDWLTNNPIANNRPLVAACKQAITFKEILVTLAQLNNKNIHFFPFPYFVSFMGLKTLELLNIKNGLRSDSLKYLNYYNDNMDFSCETVTNISFRPFELAAIRG